MSVVINGIEYVPKLKLHAIDGESFGASLRRMRKAAGYTLQKAADEIGCTKSYMWELEKDGAEPGLRMASKIAEAYGVPLHALARCLNVPHNEQASGGGVKPLPLQAPVGRKED